LIDSHFAYTWQAQGRAPRWPPLNRDAFSKAHFEQSRRLKGVYRGAEQNAHVSLSHFLEALYANLQTNEATQLKDPASTEAPQTTTNHKRRSSQYQGA